jgi:hypothetical protein
MWTHLREAASVALVKELIGAQRDYKDRGDIMFSSAFSIKFESNLTI